jgi:hypothetical protein
VVGCLLVQQNRTAVLPELVTLPVLILARLARPVPIPARPVVRLVPIAVLRALIRARRGHQEPIRARRELARRGHQERIRARRGHRGPILERPVRKGHLAKGAGRRLR